MMLPLNNNPNFFLTHLALISLLQITLALNIASALQWIEHTPQPYAISHFYNGTTRATLSSGGVANLSTHASIHLAANAETQGLKQYAQHRNIRLIYVICEVPYRIVANRAAGIKTLADLKGKKIGAIAKSSSAVFVHNMMSSVGVKDGEYTVVGGDVCMKAPCGEKTFPSLLKAGKIDAFGIWESSVELGVQALGAKNAILFQNATVYREVYSLYSTTEKLNNAATRRDIVAFVRALNQTGDVFTNRPDSVYQTVAELVKMDKSVLKAVWKDHLWTGTWGPELLDFLVEEDRYLARTDNRSVMTRADLRRFLDTSVIDEI